MEQFTMADVFAGLGKENTIEWIRKTNYMTQSQMASLIGCSLRTYTDKESNKRPFTLSEIIKIWEINNHKKILIKDSTNEYEIILKRL